MVANADIGPKAFVMIDFIGLQGKTYYVTLLSETQSTIRYRTVEYDDDGNYKIPTFYQESDVENGVFQKFAEYKDSDGFFFLQLFTDCTETHQFLWPSHVPSLFKILLYFPDTDTFVISDRIDDHNSSFESFYIVDTTGLNFSDGAFITSKMVLKARKSYINEFLSFIACVLLTIIIESGIAILFGYRKKRQITIIAIVNFSTQVILNFGLLSFNRILGSTDWNSFILLEIIVVVTEGLIYTKWLCENGKSKTIAWKTILYALTSNMASCLIGLLLMCYFPNILP